MRCNEEDKRQIPELSIFVVLLFRSSVIKQLTKYDCIIFKSPLTHYVQKLAGVKNMTQFIVHSDFANRYFLEMCSYQQQTDFCIYKKKLVPVCWS